MVCCEQIIIEHVKKNYMLFRNRPPDIEIILFSNNQQITRVHVKKCLGVYIDESLNWKSNKYGQIKIVESCSSHL